MTAFVAALWFAAVPADASVVVLEARSGKVRETIGPVDRRFTPGSAIKPFTAAALGDIETRLPCPRELLVGGRSLACSHPRLNSPVDLIAALAYSCNHFFVRSSVRLDSARFTASLRRFGFEARTPATNDELALAAIGVSGVRCSTSELAGAYRMLVREATTAVRDGLAAAAKVGTAQLARPAGVSIAGKTGTSDGRAWFAGWAPSDVPQVVVAVSVPQGRGAVDAAPLARAAFERHVRSNSGRAELRVQVRPGTVQLLPLERYVAGVVAAEGGVLEGREALKALAAAARTYAIRNRGRHKSEGFDLCATTHCQALRLDAPPSTAVAGAVEATEGELLWFEGRPAEAFYGRHCGGTTAGVREIWPEIRAPYLRQQPDSYCMGRGNATWSAEFTRSAIQIVRRTPSGRVAELAVDGRRLTAEQFHKQVGDQYGWARVRSFDFQVVERAGKTVFEGRGFGHGVGLCQMGAAERARAGHDYRQILAFYYPGTAVGLTASGLGWVYGGGERVSVFGTSDAEVRQVSAAAERALGQAERRSGWPARSRPVVRVYPTVGAFRDATGLSGNLAASTRASVVRLQPLGVLRSRGMLESTLLHEMLHVLVEQNARPAAPGWLREGIVLWLSGTPANSPEYRDALTRVQRLVQTQGPQAVLNSIK